MDLVVQQNKATWGGHVFDCSVGKGGIKKNKIEGDGATPVGRFPFRRIYYRSDRLPEVKSSLASVTLSPTDGWCDDPADSAYNQYVKLPYDARHEKLWREDHIYDVILVVGHNDDPVIPGEGSAVFIHLCRQEMTPTDGCIAFRLDNLLQILKECDLTSCLIVEKD